MNKNNTINMTDFERSSSPMRFTYYPNIDFSTFLNSGEFQRIDSNGNRICPPAPPRAPFEMRICSCMCTYQIVHHKSQQTMCGFCIAHGRK